MFKSNCHTHTLFCDGKNTAEEMVQAAIDKGFCSLGFSGHSPMTFENNWAIKEDRVVEYVNHINELKEKYKDKIEIYTGLELDKDHTPIDRSLFDYVIGSVHALTCSEKVYSVDYTADELRKCINTEFEGNALAMVKQYYSTLAKFICNEKPDVVGHFDLIEKFNEDGSFFDSSSMEYRLMAQLYLERICLECPDIIFEVNTGAMARIGKKQPYPALFLLKQLNEFGMKITISSDAHSADTLDFAFDTAVQSCKECGYNEIYILKNGGFMPIKI